MPDVIRLRLDGILVAVPVGTSIAAALMNAGSNVARRSVSGTPRGPLCGMGVCQECRVTIDGIPHQRACMILVQEGLDVRTDGAAEMQKLIAQGGPPRGENTPSASR